MPYKRKPRVLKRKNIKRRTGARAQSKQIVALSKQVSSLTKSQYETVQGTPCRIVPKRSDGTVLFYLRRFNSLMN